MTALVRALLDELEPDDLDALAELLASRLAIRLSTAPDNGWLDTKAAAAHLGISVHALHRLTADRTVPFHQDRPGARCWFRRSELDEWREGATPGRGVLTHPAGRHPRLS
jgi:Helix-turn-helix domain